MNARCFLCLVAVVLLHPAHAPAREQVLDARLHHLRNGSEPEWRSFPRQVEGPSLLVRFQATPNTGECALRLRQQDVKQTWKVLLNANEIGRLRIDENDTIIYLPIPVGGLVAGENTLVVEQQGRIPDDIRVGEITLDDRAVDQVLSETSVELLILDGDPADQSTPLPCRITVLNAQGALMTVSATSNEHLAVRPGVVYSGNGHARFGLPAGTYTIHAGRGFEYGLDSARLTLRAGERARRQLSIRREVPVHGMVSCDTHVHTLTYSGHGDATLDERVLTLAGEGIELPIATEHNRQIDYQAAAVKHNVRQYFTPVVGNEVTTTVGHFNIFPVRPDSPAPDSLVKDWKVLFNSIAHTGARGIILNHPYDRHSDFRPFGPEHHNMVTGENLDGWVLRANAMEVINSAAQQTEILRPYQAWFGMLNRGVFLTPVGASDSHDVSRFIVGQARTYIRCKRETPGNIDVQEAVANFLAGRVLVSLGLMADITVNDKYGPGDLVAAADEVKVAVRVLGPSWVTAEKVELYANGHKIREASIPDGKHPGVKWKGEWTLPRFKHDVHLVAVASGPGVGELYWPIAKPYQPTSTDVDRRVLGSTGAVWLDADGDGKRTSAFAYAQRLLRDAGADLPKLVQLLDDYDEAVAAQVAGLLQMRGVSPQDPLLREAVRKAGAHVERGFQAFLTAWRKSQIARTQPH